MNLTVEIPDNVAGQLGATGGDLARRVLETFALEEYKNGRMSENALRRTLGFTRYELDGFLKTHDIWIDFTVEDVRRDVETLERFAERHVSARLAMDSGRDLR